MTKQKVPVVAIIGRANVGKSSLFNAILGRRENIVAREPGTTRDSIMAKASIFINKNAVTSRQSSVDSKKTEYRIQNTGYAAKVRQDFWLIDTAGAKDPADDFESTIQEQITQSIVSADVIWLVVEASTVITQEDRQVAKQILKSKKPVFLVVNKTDKVHPRNILATVTDWQKLGIKTIIPTSVTQRFGIDELLDKLSESIPKANIKVSPDRLRLAILGRPNVGKSYLFNTLASKQQAVVAPRAGTTRDINRIMVKYEGREIELMDTAGLRRSGKIEKGIERFSVIRSLSAIEQSDICALLIDATEPNVVLDQKIAGMVKEAGKGLVLIVSKWDLLDTQGAPLAGDKMTAALKSKFDFVPWAPVIFTSAETGRNVTKIFDIILQIDQQSQRLISTSELNKWLREAANAHPPAGLKNRQPKLNYIVQEGDNPTNFKIYGAHTRFLHWSYKRYLERLLRTSYGFMGSPIKFWFFNKHEETRGGGRRAKSGL